MEALVYVLSDVKQMLIKQYYEAMIYNNECFLVADIVKVSQHGTEVTQTSYWVGYLDTGGECDWLLAQSMTR